MSVTRWVVSMALAGAALGGCAERAAAPAPPVFRYAETIRMSQDLVNVRAAVDLSAPPGAEEDYAGCVAAGYALAQGFAFARHVRTTLREEGGLRIGDAVYTLSPALPAGRRTIDAETKAAACGESGIPTV